MPCPSYIDGCYPLVGRPRYPELWHRCIFAAAPCLGPTGATLHEQSMFHRDGTLTNMDVSSDWVLSGGRYALDFDGSNDYVTHPVLSSTTSEMSVCGWMYFTGGTVLNYWAITDVSAATLAFGFEVGVFAGKWVLWVFRGSIPSVESIANAQTNEWVHVAGTASAAGMQLFVNGSLVNSNNSNAAMVWSSQSLIVGSRQRGGYAEGWLGRLDDLRVYDRVISASEVRLLARRRGIAYETVPTNYSNPPTLSTGAAAKLVNGGLINSGLIRGGLVG